MKVICKINNINSLPDGRLLRRLKKFIPRPDEEFDLEIGKEYTVYGLVFWDNCPWYYLCSEEYAEYPTPYAIELFNISDDQLSSYWKLSSECGSEGKVSSSLVFDEWAKDPSFYERLVDGDLEAEALFAKYRRLMDREI